MGQPEPAWVMARTAASFRASSWGNSSSCCSESLQFCVPGLQTEFTTAVSCWLSSLSHWRSQETPQQHLKASAEADLPLPGYGSREPPGALHFGFILFLKSQNIVSWKRPTTIIKFRIKTHEVGVFSTLLWIARGKLRALLVWLHPPIHPQSFQWQPLTVRDRNCNNTQSQISGYREKSSTSCQYLKDKMKGSYSTVYEEIRVRSTATYLLIQNFQKTTSWRRLAI